MGSLSRRLAKHLRWHKPKAALPVSEGFLLSQRLERAAKANNATNPLHFLEYLRQMRRGYDPKHDGPSDLMRLVDEIIDFEQREGARIAALVGQGKQ